MPLFTVTMNSNRSLDEKDRFSRAIHAQAFIEVLISSGTARNRKKGQVIALFEKLGEAGTDPNDITVFFLETDRANGPFGGGRSAPPVDFARR